MKKKSILRKILWFTTFMVIGGIIGFFAAKVGVKPIKTGLPEWTAPALIILVIPLFLLVVAFHEAGHALAGIFVKFDFRMYVVGPLLWEREQSGWHFKWNKNVNTAGGMVICMPLDSTDLKRRFSLYAAGGPIASLVLTLIAYGLYKLAADNEAPVSEIRQFVSLVFGVLSFFSFIIFFATAIPVHAGGFSSDGARVWRIQKGGETSRFEVLILKIISGSAGGIRPRLLDANELNEALSLARKLKSPYEVYLYNYLYQLAMDNDDFILAGVYMKSYIENAHQIPEGIRNGVWLEAAFFYAYAKGDLEMATSYWKQFKPAALISKAQVCATEAALAKLNNCPEEAVSKIKLSREQLPNMLDQGLAIALRDRLARMEHDLQVASSSV